MIYPQRSSFVAQDIEALKQDNRIREFAFGTPKGFRNLGKQLQLFALLILNIRQIKGIYCWFGDYHSLIPALWAKCFRKPFVLAIGGYDAANLPEWNYGGHRSRFRSKCIVWSYQMATQVIYSSRFTLAQMHLRLNALAIDPDKELIIYPGVTPNSATPPNVPRTYRMIYVAAGDTVGRMHIKGVDRFLAVIQPLAHLQFLLVGPSGLALNWVKSQAPKHLEVLGPLDAVSLNAQYQQSETIALFSRFEAFGMVMLEGMNQGCFPITLEAIGAAEIIHPHGPGKTFSEFHPEEISAFLREFEFNSAQVPALQERVKFFQPAARAKAIQRIFE